MNFFYMFNKPQKMMNLVLQLSENKDINPLVNRFKSRYNLYKLIQIKFMMKKVAKFMT
ncbi:hypothetical protein JOC77_000622 [Peribacillus deserti]|uniref:Uncharacterized protein n=1 Tax=Peribacillus deserti TaxID=673318 RepID=A0ABS2QDH3_9BACI|nr:hypothetical protein [Peribacillus deserti]